MKYQAKGYFLTCRDIEWAGLFKLQQWTLRTVQISKYHAIIA